MLLKRIRRWGIVGVVPGADGSTPATGRQGKTGEAITGIAHGKYYEAASRGTLYAGCAQAGVAPGTALGTTACLSLYNPVDSQVRLSICLVGLGYISGTIGAGTMFHCANIPSSTAVTAVTVPTGTAITSARLGLGTQSSKAPQGVVKTGATVTTPTALFPFCSLTAVLATTAVGLYSVIEDMNGMIVIEPGYCYMLQAIAAGGSTPLVAPAVVWEEIPIVATNG